MKKLLLGSLLSLSLLVSTTSCDPCTGCGPISSEPSIESTFYNIDSLLSVQDSLVIVDTLKVVVDSLLLVVDSIGKGGSLDSERQALENYIDGLTSLRINQTDSMVAKSLDSLEDLLNGQVSLINSGKNPINFLEIEGTGLTSEKDSSVYHYLPLLLTNEMTIHNLEIGDDMFSLEITHELSDYYDEDRRVIRSAFVNSLLQTGFDSLFCFCESDTVSCESLDCDATSTSIKGYF